jgi:creatinine amidohydrolase
VNSPPPLCIADDATFWAWHRWPDFARWRAPAETVVVVPLAGLADWGLGHSLDLEETVLLSVLRAAAETRPSGLRLLMVPPLRFVLGPAPGCAFAIDPPTAHGLVAEVLASIAASGFRRVVLANASPWNEELIAAAARDARIALRLQVFRISLSGLGLDLHPVRSPERRRVQTLGTFLLERAPEPAPAAEPAPARAWGDESVTPLPGPAATLEQARAEGPALLATAAHKLVALLQAIAARPPLPFDGVIPPATP